ncbi:hypothetical protein EXS65_04595 [Candidatus Peribacteria bacterium]|nr:hypothetical protein [Candidatus Peribacteria bacterium]
MNTKEKAFDYRMTERAFLFAFIALRLLLLARTFGQYLGYDVRGHLQVVSTISWLHPFVSPHTLYYAVHPPLGFLLAHTLTLFGISPLLAAQMLACVASFGAFFFMRLTLRSLNLLHTVPGIVFLYLGASIPMQIYLSIIVGLDVFVLSGMSMVLFFSVQIFWKPQKPLPLFLHAVLVIGTLLLATLFKTSGFPLLPIPFLVFFFSEDRTWKRFLMAMVTILIPFFLSLFFLYERFYLREHTFFFSTAGLFIWVDLFRMSVEWRDAHPFLFSLSYIFPIRESVPRLMPTWNSFWFMYDREFASIFTAFLGVFYNSFAAVFCIFGVIAVFLQRLKPDCWHRFGAIIFSCTIVQVFCLVAYMWSMPLFGYLANKGVYIASASWGIAYLLTVAAISLFTLMKQNKPPVREVEQYVLSGTALFMVINHLMPDIAGIPNSFF